MSIRSRLSGLSRVSGVAPLCAGLLVGAWLRAAAVLVGGASAVFLSTLLALLCAAGVAGLRAPGRRLDGLCFLPAVAMVAADPLLRGLGLAREALDLKQASVYAILLGGVFASSLPALSRLRPDRPGGSALWMTLGVGVGALVLPAPLSAALAGLGALSVPSFAGAPRARQPFSHTVAAGGAAAALSLAVVGLRTSLDPSALPMLVGVVAAGLGLALGRARPPRSRGFSVLGAGLLLAGTWALLALAPDGTAALARASLDAPGGSSAGLALLGAPLVGIAAGGGLALGQLCGPSPGRGPLFGVALGLAAGPALLGTGPDAVLWLTVALALALLVGSGDRWTQLGSLGLLALCAAAGASLPSPDPARLTAGRATHLQDAVGLDKDAAVRDALRATWTGWAAGTSGAVRAPVETVEAGIARAREGGGSADPAIVEPVVVELEGVVAEARSRAGDAEALAGHLAGMLAVDDAAALVLGDDAGRALRALSATPPRSAEVSVPAPPALRAVARLDATAERAWLRPEVRLRALGPGLALRLTPQADLILEISRVPWSDGAHTALDPSHLRAVAARLKRTGLYVAAVHLGAWPKGAPQALVRTIADHFSSVQLWLPPSGADTLIVVASDAPLPLARLLARAPRAADALRALDIQTPLDLAGFAVADRAAALAWAGEEGDLPSGFRLSPMVFARPVLHLASLAGHTAAPDAIWDWAGVTDAELARNALSQRGRAREIFLELLGKAAEGDLESVFQRANALLKEAGTAGSDALDPLLEPHLKAARAALARAQKEGLASRAWDEARAEAVTAQMLNPASPAPHLIQGDLAFAQGNLRQSEDHYNEALARDSTNITAMTGLARVKRLRGDRLSAEELLRRATRAAPQTWSTWQNLGVFLVETGRGEEATDALRKAASLDEQRAAPHIALAELALTEKAPTRALVEVERALQLEPSGYAWYLRGRAHFELSQPNLAEEDFRSAVLADPSLVEARGAIGHLQALRGELDAAAESFQAVLSRDPNNTAARENLKRLSEQMARRGAPEPQAP